MSLPFWIVFMTSFVCRVCGPPDVQIMRKRAGADLAQAVGFGEVFDGDDGGHKNLHRKEKT
jgi:hypothetical protein